MLVLGRREGERIILQIPGYPDVTIQVRNARSHMIRLAFEAPPEVKIIREELLKGAPLADQKNANVDPA